MVASRTWRGIVYGTIVFETIVYISHILYTTLAYQIKNGRTSGFLDAEICARDVRFITPWNCLRSYLESKLKLTVVSLIQITRNHFREKDTSFFTEIRNAFQSATKLPPDFVFRILSMQRRTALTMKIYSIVICFMLFLLVSGMAISTSDVRHHCVKIFLIRSYSGPNVGKYGPE